jgi:DNA-binding NtrC family response regulator
MPQSTILVVEDDPIMGESLVQRLRLEHYAADWAHDLSEARAALQRKRYPLVLSDIRLPDGDGAEMLDLLRKRQGSCCPPVVFMTGYGTVDQAVRLVREGAWDYIQKPFDINDLMRRLHDWVQPEADAATWFGVSAAAQALEQLVDRLAPLDLPVLVQGASGTGKELVATRIHTQMQKHAGRHLPFLAINCAAIAEGLFESELFGHEAGAFSGAQKRHLGLFEQAHGGVLFLDEIGDMPLAMQARLLRVLQDGTLRRVGGEKAIHVEVRLVCATHKPLERMAAEGQFRSDLLFRISGLPIYIPPLRDRPDDIVWLAHRRVDSLNVRNTQNKRLDPRFIGWACAQEWEGNVRELFAHIDRAYHLSRDCWVRWEQSIPSAAPRAPSADSTAQNAPAPLHDYLAQVERDYLNRCLTESGGRMSATASQLGISRKTLWDKLRRHNLQSDDGADTH